jgi:hypothetical protein
VGARFAEGLSKKPPISAANEENVRLNTSKDNIRIVKNFFILNVPF